MSNEKNQSTVHLTHNKEMHCLKTIDNLLKKH